MTGPDIHRFAAGTVTFQMRLHRPRWSYEDDQVGRLVEVEVELGALERLSDENCAGFTTPSMVGKRALVEQAAQRIIDREGPNFAQPVRVRARDV